MGIPVLILGDSGSGKSYSMRKFAEGEVGVFNVASKPFPFPEKLPKVNKATVQLIMAGLAKGGKKTYVIDDSQYLLSFQLFNKANEVGYQKFTDIAVSFYKLISFVVNNTPPDTIVYFLHHAEHTDDGRVKPKTVGKMLDNQLTVEGLFSIVLLCRTDGKRHYFETQSDGYTVAKSPVDMFDREIDNDLKFVDEKIREYYEFNESEEIKS